MNRIFRHLKLILMLSVSVSFIGCSYQHETKTIDILNSPGQTYEISVRKFEEWSVIDRTVKYVNLTTVKGLKELNLKDPLYYENDYDGDTFTDFETLYPDRRWLNDRIFWMGNKRKPETAPNKIRIINDSQRKISQVILESMGFFSIYDIDVDENIEIPNSWEGLGPEIFNIGLAVYYEDGTSFPGKGYGLNSNLTVKNDGGDFDIIIGNGAAFILSFDKSKIRK